MPTRLTDSWFFLDWRFYAYFATLGALVYMFVKVGQHLQEQQKNPPPPEAEPHAQAVQLRMLTLATSLIFLVLLYIASGRFLLSYMLLLGAVGLLVAFGRKILQRLVGIDTPEIQRRIRVMSYVGVSRAYAIAVFLVYFVLMPITLIVCLVAVIYLRYANLPADQAVLYQLIWLFVVPTVAGFCGLGVVNFIQSFDPKTDRYIRLNACVTTLVAALSLATSLALPYSVFSPQLIASATWLPSDISHLYWGIGAVLLVTVFPYVLGVIGYNAHRAEILTKTEIWLKDFETVIAGGQKSHFALMKGQDSVMSIPGHIHDLIGDNVFLAAYWVWKWQPIAEHVREICDPTRETTIASKSELLPQDESDQMDGSQSPPLAERTTASVDDDNAPRNLSTEQPTMLLPQVSSTGLPHQDALSGILDERATTARMENELKRAFSFLWEEPFHSFLQGYLDSRRKDTFQRLEADLRRWNYKVKLIDAYTELLVHCYEQDRSRSIAEHLQSEIEQRKSRLLAMVGPGITLGTLGSGLITLLIELVKRFGG